MNGLCCFDSFSLFVEDTLGEMGPKSKDLYKKNVVYMYKMI